MDKSMTMIVHSNDFDKAMAAFIVATAAAAKGMKVTLFFTFWGLFLLKKGGAQKAKLSKMNMGGLGTSMMKKIMKKKGVADIPELLADAKELGVDIVACEMTMDLMGVSKDQMIPEVTRMGGVGEYLDAAKEGHVNLFV